MVWTRFFVVDTPVVEVAENAEGGRLFVVAGRVLDDAAADGVDWRLLFFATVDGRLLDAAAAAGVDGRLLDVAAAAGVDGRILDVAAVEEEGWLLAPNAKDFVLCSNDFGNVPAADLGTETDAVVAAAPAATNLLGAATFIDVLHVSWNK